MAFHYNIDEEQVAFLKCIGDVTRLRILKYIINEEKCVNDIASAIGKEQSLVSHHLKSLKNCNIVTAQRKAKKIYYELADSRIAQIIIHSESLVKELHVCQKEGCNE